MNLITYLITGALFGSIAGRIMGTNSPLGLLVDVYDLDRQGGTPS